MTPHFQKPVTLFWGSVPLRFSSILHLNIPLYCTIYFLCHNLGTHFCYRLLNWSIMLQYIYYDASFSETVTFFLGSVPLRFSSILHLNIPLYCSIYFLSHNLGTNICFRLLNWSKMPKYIYYDASFSETRNIIFWGVYLRDLQLNIPLYCTIYFYVIIQAHIFATGCST